jgi:hypothetical protein
MTSNHPFHLPIKTLVVSGLTLSAMKSIQWFKHSDTLCLFKNITGLPCPACGMTHAFWDYIKFDVVGAYQHNALSVVLFPIASIVIGIYLTNRWGMTDIPLFRWMKSRQNILIALAVFVMLTNWSINLQRFFSELA